MAAPRRLGMGELGRFLYATLGDPVSDERRDTGAALTRRRAVAALTLVSGAGLLGFSLNLTPGDRLFYLTTLLLATVWTVGALASGPLHLGWAHTRAGTRPARPIVQPLAMGLLAVAVFGVAALVVAQIPVLADQVNSVLDYARYASLPLVALITLVNGLAEEVFFRGALFSAVGERRPVLVTTGLYALTTAATGNAMLVLSAVLLGALVGRQRQVTGGVLSPMITHVTWSLSLLFLLPPLLEALT